MCMNEEKKIWLEKLVLMASLDQIETDEDLEDMYVKTRAKHQEVVKKSPEILSRITDRALIEYLDVVESRRMLDIHFTWVEWGNKVMRRISDLEGRIKQLEGAE